MKPGDLIVVKPKLRWSTKCDMLHMFLHEIQRPSHVIPLPEKQRYPENWIEVLRSDGKVLQVEMSHFETA